MIFRAVSYGPRLSPHSPLRSPTPCSPFRRYSAHPRRRRQTPTTHPSHQSPPRSSPPTGAPSAGRNALLLLATGYAITINVFAAGLFWYDKHQAQTRGWRVPEKQLQLTALLGGWAGGMWAMQTFRHKTAKESFRTPYMLCVGGNVLLCAGAAGAWGLGLVNVSRLVATWVKKR